MHSEQFSIMHKAFVIICHMTENLVRLQHNEILQFLISTNQKTILTLSIDQLSNLNIVIIIIIIIIITALIS